MEIIFENSFLEESKRRHFIKIFSKMTGVLKICLKVIQKNDWNKLIFIKMQFLS